MPALEQLEVREISVRFLSQDERIEIADLRQAGIGVRGIARQLGRARRAAVPSPQQHVGEAAAWIAG